MFDQFAAMDRYSHQRDEILEQLLLPFDGPLLGSKHAIFVLLQFRSDRCIVVGLVEIDLALAIQTGNSGK